MQVTSMHLTAIETHLRIWIILIFSALRQRLLDARTEAKLVITGVEEKNEGASREAKRAHYSVFLVEESNSGEAILRSATEIQPTGEVRGQKALPSA